MTFVAKITKQRNRKKKKNQVILIRLVKVLYFDFRNKLDHFFLLIHDSKKKFAKKNHIWAADCEESNFSLEYETPLSTRSTNSYYLHGYYSVFFSVLDNQWPNSFLIIKRTFSNHKMLCVIHVNNVTIV